MLTRIALWALFSLSAFVINTEMWYWNLLSFLGYRTETDWRFWFWVAVMVTSINAIILHFLTERKRRR